MPARSAGPFGKVSISGDAAGTWTTNNQNQIAITLNDGSTVANDVGWQFDGDNHLCLFSGANQIFDFHDVPGNRPLCGTLNAVLMVRPDRANAFTFQLRGDWSLDDGHDLNFTVNGVKSVIDGFIDDPRDADRGQPFSAVVEQLVKDVRVGARAECQPQPSTVQYVFSQLLRAFFAQLRQVGNHNRLEFLQPGRLQLLWRNGAGLENGPPISWFLPVDLAERGAHQVGILL